MNFRYFLGPGQKVPQILALGLSSRKNLCVHPSVAGKVSAPALNADSLPQFPATVTHRWCIAIYAHAFRAF